MASAQTRASYRSAEVEVSVADEMAQKQKTSKVKQLCTFLKTACTPNMYLYLPKSVNVGNNRIGFMYIFFLVIIFVVIIVFMMLPQNNSIEVKADIKVSVCDESCQIREDEMDRLVTQGMRQSYCTAGSSYQSSVDKGGTYFPSGASCARRCGDAASSSACLYPFELHEVGREEAFIPTFFRESFVKQPDNSGGCGAGYTNMNNRCEKVQDFYVTGADDLKVSFSHYFSVLPHYNSLSFSSQPAAMMAHSGSFHAKGWDEGMLTVLLSPSGKELDRFRNAARAQIAVKDLLSAAYSDEGSNLGLDSVYKRNNMGMTDSLPIRLTGASVTIDVFVTGSGVCKIFSKDASTEVKKVDVDWKGPLACLTVHADPRWVSRTAEQPLGLNGGYRTRQKNGIHIKFRKMGFFTFTDEQALLRSLTAALMWLKLPLIITYLFSIVFLGSLSDIYAHLTRQEVNAAEACKGFSMRLLTYSSAFMDLRGKTGADGGADGITRRCVAERIGAITRGMEVEPSVLSKMIDVIYDSFKAYKKQNAPDSDVVTCQEYCVACSNNEPITLETLVKIFDKDRPLGFFESIFLDKALAKVREAAMREAAEVEAAFQAGADVSDPDAAHSYIVQAYRDVQFMMKDLGRIEDLALQTAKDLDVNPSTLGLMAKASGGSMAGAPAGTVLPKLKQSVSSDSIGDEGDPTKRDFRDIER